MNTITKNLIASRAKLFDKDQRILPRNAEEGGCGVTGFICSVPVKGKHIYKPSVQMHNRGNGKGGGIAAVGLCAEDLGVSQEVLDSHYLLNIALLDKKFRKDVETANIEPFFDIHSGSIIPSVKDYRKIEGLEVQPPEALRYFVRVKPEVLEKFIDKNGLGNLEKEKAEDEFVYQNSLRLNKNFYSSMGEQKAFVLSHGKNMMILKIVGYAENAVLYYKLQDFKAHGWIAHQRYPTKGKVWHPGGAHPFIGMHEALVHNGDFANYYGVSEYLKQHNIFPQFLTDTEVAILMIDLLKRTYGYPMEYLIEAIAPTTEYDFDLLPAQKQEIYRYIQSSHISSSPDGPWFFIIAENDPYEKAFKLIGITDTSMLRPQVFALQDSEVKIGLICSEKQAIDATLESLAEEDDRFCPVADVYWNARGGSASDGGAFIFTVKEDKENVGKKTLVCSNKFGEIVTAPYGQKEKDFEKEGGTAKNKEVEKLFNKINEKIETESAELLKKLCEDYMEISEYSQSFKLFDSLQVYAKAGYKEKAIDILTHLNDARYYLGGKKRGLILAEIRKRINKIFDLTAPLKFNAGVSMYAYIDKKTAADIREPIGNESILVINAVDFPPEGDDCDATFIVKAYKAGWKRFICYGYKGQRFCGCGLSKDSNGVRIDVYGSSGDYLASGIDGLEMYVHDNAQDQLGQIMKRGKLVIYGDAGQTFMYGAKGGEVFVMGNLAGRPLINAAGSPKVVINGTCLDYLAESFMAGDPLNGGGFVVLNGVKFNEEEKVVPLKNPYSGSNLFSLAAGGALYIRDPYKRIQKEQLNGGEIVKLMNADWNLIAPYLEENEKLFGISVENDLLKVSSETKSYKEVYRKIKPAV
ncbi:MAG: glutamate synthase [Deltaproteobacteria bacterium]|nr:glutamate synthase [Deltaproteobacteria bacterium]